MKKIFITTLLIISISSLAQAEMIMETKNKNDTIRLFKANNSNVTYITSSGPNNRSVVKIIEK
jgi:thioredoxin-related protein